MNTICTFVKTIHIYQTCFTICTKKSPHIQHNFSLLHVSYLLHLLHNFKKSIIYRKTYSSIIIYMNRDIIPHNDVLNMLELSILVYNYGKDFS